jgi:hypothetical protein
MRKIVFGIGLLFISLFFKTLTGKEEICDLRQKDCFPIYNNDFTKLLSQFKDSEIEKSVNQYSKSKNFFKKKLEFRKTPDRGMALFALERIPNGFNYISVPFDECIGKNEYYRILKAHNIPVFEFQMPNEDVLNLERLRLVFTMHYVLANLWESRFFGDLIGLPKYATSPTLTIPYAAVQHMYVWEKNEVLQLREKTKKRYEFYVKKIKDNIPEATLEKMLNGTKLNFANFAYCLSIFESRSATLERGNNKDRDTALVPGFQYVNTLDELKISDQRVGGFTTDNQMVSISAPGDIAPGDEAFNLYGRFNNWRFLINFGYLPRINEHECLKHENSTLAKRINKIPASIEKNSKKFFNFNINHNYLLKIFFLN